MDYWFNSVVVCYRFDWFWQIKFECCILKPVFTSCLLSLPAMLADNV